MSVPTFHFLDSFSQISGAEINKLLGRFVLDRWNPMVQGHEPADPSRILTPNFISEDLNFSSAQMYISTISHTSMKAAAQKALMAGRSCAAEGGVTLSGSQVSKRGLNNARSAFEALMRDLEVATSVQKMMEKAKADTVWMITAILYVDDAHMEINASKSRQMDVKSTLQIPITALAGLPALGLDVLDIHAATISASRQKESRSKLAATMTERRVFAIQYWRCELPNFLRRVVGYRALLGKELQTVDTGHMGLGDSEDEDEKTDEDDLESPPLLLAHCELPKFPEDCT